MKFLMKFEYNFWWNFWGKKVPWVLKIAFLVDTLAVRDCKRVCNSWYNISKTVSGIQCKWIARIKTLSTNRLLSSIPHTAKLHSHVWPTLILVTKIYFIFLTRRIPMVHNLHQDPFFEQNTASACLDPGSRILKRTPFYPHRKFYKKIFV